MPVGIFDDDGAPDSLSKTPASDIGENTGDILSGAGYAPDRMAALRAEGVIG